MKTLTLKKIDDIKNLVEYTSVSGKCCYAYRFMQNKKRNLIIIAEIGEIEKDKAIEIAKKCELMLKNGECVKSYIRSERMNREDNFFIFQTKDRSINKPTNNTYIFQFKDYEIEWLLEKLKLLKKGKDIHKATAIVEKIESIVK